jgi:hypothetical protein
MILASAVQIFKEREGNIRVYVLVARQFLSTIQHLGLQEHLMSLLNYLRVLHLKKEAVVFISYPQKTWHIHKRIGNSNSYPLLK